MSTEDDASTAPVTAEGSDSESSRRQRPRLWTRVKHTAAGANRLVVFLAVLIPMLSALGISVAIFHPGSSGELLGPQLSLSDITLSPSRVISNGNQLEVASGEEIDVTVINTGKQTTVVTGANVTVLKAGTLHLCWSQGGSGFLVPARLALKIPPTAEVGQTYATRDPHFAVAPGDAQRFLINVTGTATTLWDRPLTRIYEFALRVIGNQNDQSPVLAKIVMAVPFNPWSGGFYLTRSLSMDEIGVPNNYRRTLRQCYLRNMPVLEQFRTLPARPDSQLAASVRTAVVPPS